MKMRICGVLFMCCAVLQVTAMLAVAGPPKLEMVWESPARLKQPESVVYDQARHRYYVSSINGKPLEKNSLGFISILGQDGDILEEQWIDGLNAPKGLALAGDKLYAADVDRLVEIDINRGVVTKFYPASTARFLNDVAVDERGVVYVSDMLTNSIYRLQGGELSAWLATPELEGPNGLLVENETLLVASWGKIKEGFSTESPGCLLAVDTATGEIRKISKGIGMLDGLAAGKDNDYYLSDNPAGKIFYGRAGQGFKPILAPGPSAADITYLASEQVLVIPMVNENRVVAYGVNGPLTRIFSSSGAEASTGKMIR